MVLIAVVGVMEGMIDAGSGGEDGSKGWWGVVMMMMMIMMMVVVCCDGRMLQYNLHIKENFQKENSTSFASISSQTSIKPLPNSCPILSISE